VYRTGGFHRPAGGDTLDEEGVFDPAQGHAPGTAERGIGGGLAAHDGNQDRRSAEAPKRRRKKDMPTGAPGGMDGMDT
jgi:hypothetical protein